MDELTRRRMLELLLASGAGSLVGCTPSSDRSTRLRPVPAGDDPPADRTGADAVLSVAPLTRPWQTRDPFLFCMHHDDRYPPGNPVMGPPPGSLAGRQMGRDFADRDGWNMYHGRRVPGFPRHPHRGFETVTLVRRGLLDHSDSLGATARFGRGDVQWLTAGGGILHAEMFPLLRTEQTNPLELFQIWLNLPAAHKMVDPHFSMLWAPTIPTHEVRDEASKRSQVTVVAGRFDGVVAPDAPPRSWASQPGADVAMWSIAMEPGARLTLPAGPEGVNRSLYFFEGRGLRVAGREIPAYHHVAVRPGSDLALTAGPVDNEILLLQGRPIGEPVARHGPFVMNSDAEIRQAYADYRRTQFGGWPWTSEEPVHPRGVERFARRPDGSMETPPA